MIAIHTRLLDICEAASITTMIAIPDPAFLALMVAAEARGWRVIAPHHEAAGGFIADAITRLSGHRALCLASPGPGIANAIPAMIAARVEGAPVIFIGAQRGPMPLRGGRFQHVEQMALIAPAVKYAGVVGVGDELDGVLHAALCAAHQGRPGPAYVEIAIPVMAGRVADGPIAPLPAVRLPSAAELACGAALIAKARAPVLLVGGGVQRAKASAAVAALAARLACPVILTPGAGGTIAGALCLPYGFSPVAAAAVAASDCVVALGTQIGEQVHFGQHRHWRGGDDARQWVQIEADGASVGVNRRIDVGLVGDLRAIVPALTARLAPRAAPAALADWRGQECARQAGLAAELPASTPGHVHPARLAHQASASLPDGGVLVRDGGAFVLWQMAYGAGRAGDVLWSGNFAHLGTGLPYAIGAGVVDPSRPILLACGDGALLFHVAELETAARLRLPIVCVVAVDHQWGLEVGMYRRVLGKGSAETGAHWGRAVRFDRLAEGFGCHGEYVDDDGALEPALARAWGRAKAGQPAVVHVAVDGDVNAGDIPHWREFAGWYADGMG